MSGSKCFFSKKERKKMGDGKYYCPVAGKKVRIYNGDCKNHCKFNDK